MSTTCNSCDQSQSGKLGKFHHSAVATDSTICSKICKDFLEREDASVADAAIATLLCSGVVNTNQGIGGGALYTIYCREEKTVFTLDAREVAPGAASREMYEHNPKGSFLGASAIGVPGEIAGFWELHQKFGKLPWKELFTPSIELCRNGFPIHKANYGLVEEFIPDMEPFFVQETREKKNVGDIVKLPKLAQTLEEIAEYGAEHFYSGDLANRIVKEIRTNDGIITKEDLANYKAKWREPVMVDLKVRGEKLSLWAAPPPSSGALVGFILKTLIGFDTDDIVPGTTSWWHRFMEVSKFAYGIRAELGDQDFVLSEVLDEVLSDTYVDSIRSKISPSTTNAFSSYGKAFMETKTTGTAHFSILGKNGDAISATSSINKYFGCRLLGKGTGILYNNTMDDFSQPSRVNLYGLPPAEANFIEPGKRPMSSMSPIIITDGNGDVRFVCGASGGSRIISAVAQVLWRTIVFEQNLKDATDAYRIFEQWLPRAMVCEWDCADEDVLEVLGRLGHKFEKVRNLRGAIVNTIERRGGWVYAYTDARIGGTAEGQ